MCFTVLVQQSGKKLLRFININYEEVLQRYSLIITVIRQAKSVKNNKIISDL